MFIRAFLAMFLTSIAARDPMLSDLAGDDQHVWTYLNLTVSRPWFLASYRIETPDGDVTETALLSYVEQVSDLMRRHQDDLCVTELMLVSPGWLNQTGNWTMQPLREIWLGDTGNGRAYMYCLSDGTRYIDSLVSADLPRFSALERLANFQDQPRPSVHGSRKG